MLVRLRPLISQRETREGDEFSNQVPEGGVLERLDDLGCSSRRRPAEGRAVGVVTVHDGSGLGVYGGHLDPDLVLGSAVPGQLAVLQKVGTSREDLSSVDDPDPRAEESVEKENGLATLPDLAGQVPSYTVHVVYALRLDDESGWWWCVGGGVALSHDGGGLTLVYPFDEFVEEVVRDGTKTSFGKEREANTHPAQFLAVLVFFGLHAPTPALRALELLLVQHLLPDLLGGTGFLEEAVSQMGVAVNRDIDL